MMKLEDSRRALKIEFNQASPYTLEREFFTDNLLVRIYFITEMI
jgi:hypothetical protein